MESTPLQTLLAEQIRQSGPLTVAEYMEHCLYHPQHGYYTRGLNFSTTPARDFVTAPELTPLFGAMVANWVAKAWQQAGNPAAFLLVEGGPGRGTLMYDLLSHLHTRHGACYRAAQPVLVETSPELTHIQRATLENFGQCTWQTALPVSGPLPVIVVANELLDAFPAEQHAHSKLNWQQYVVALNGANELTFTTRPAPRPPHLPAHWQPAEGALLESSPAQMSFIAQLRSHAAAALIIDYGYRHLPPTGGHTLQGLYKHQKVSPLFMPGEADLTTHVNFAQVTAALGLEEGVVEDLAPFLLRHGLVELGLQHPSQQSALQRLLHPAQMGSLFKVVEYNRSAQ